MSKPWLLLQVVLCSVPAIYCGDYDRLVNDLFSGYQKLAPPRNVSAGPLAVGVRLGIMRLEKLNMTKGNFEAVCLLLQRWTDDRLQWDPNEYDGIDMLSLPRSEMWVPDITLLRAHKPTRPLYQSKVVLKSSGEVDWEEAFHFTTQCRSPKKREMECDLEFGSRTEHKGLLEIDRLSEIVDLAIFTRHDMWEAVKSSSKLEDQAYPCCGDDTKFAKVTYTVEFKLRKGVLEDEDKDKGSGGAGLSVSLAVLLWSVITCLSSIGRP